MAPSPIKSENLHRLANQFRQDFLTLNCLSRIFKRCLKILKCHRCVNWLLFTSTGMYRVDSTVSSFSPFQFYLISFFRLKRTQLPRKLLKMSGPNTYLVNTKGKFFLKFKVSSCRQQHYLCVCFRVETWPPLRPGNTDEENSTDRKTLSIPQNIQLIRLSFLHCIFCLPSFDRPNF